MEVLWRLALCAGVVVAALLVLRLYRWIALRGASAQHGFSQPQLLYFMSRNCAPCVHVQGPVVKKLQQAFGRDVVFRTIDVDEESRLAKDFRILSLPTTVLIDSKGTAREINPGVVTFRKLETQIRKILPELVSPSS